ncbi:hypothetical protein ACIHQR_10640 [Corallococcus coralloides]|uniref:hypothetical protein n=1 Tax=Corallococcus coralloides TaxID=184914 RepID=UPI00384C7F2A
MAASQPLKAAPTAYGGPAVAYGDTRYFVVWSDSRAGELYGSPVAQDGTMLKPGGVRLNPSDLDVQEVAIAFNGTHFFVVWQTAADGVFGVRVTPDGTVDGPVFTVLYTGEALGKVAIACSEALCLVATTIEGDAETVIYFERVTKDGTVLPTGNQRTVSPGYNYARQPAVSWDNTDKEFLVVWTDERGGEATPDIYGNRVTEAGVVLDGKGFAISKAAGAQETPDVVWTGRRFQVVWADGRSGGTDIYGARVRRNGTVDDPNGLPISTAPGRQTTPRLAHHNSKSLVVWDDMSSGAHRIRGARWGEDGDVWDPFGFTISSGDQPAEFLPAVAYGANRFLTAFAAGATTAPGFPHFMLGARVTHEATVKDSPALVFTKSRH